MNRFRFCVLALVLNFWITNAAFAQVNWFYVDGKTPKKVDFIASQNGQTVQTPQYWVIAESPLVKDPRKPADLEGNTRRNQKLKFGEIYYAAKDQIKAVSSSGKTWYLLVKRDENDEDNISEILGWVQRESLLTTVWPLVYKESNIYKKALLININNHENISQIMEVKTYKGPGLNYESGVSLRAKHVYYIYKEFNNFVLLGLQARISSGEAATNNIVGWIEKDNMVEWRTTDAVQAKDDNTLLYKEWNDLVDGRSSSNRLEPIKRFNTPRAPILESSKDSDGGCEARNKIGHCLNPKAYQVGNFGSLGDVSLEVLEEFKHLMGGVIAKNQKLEILFIVDGSRSMQDYMVKVGETVRNFAVVINEKFRDAKFSVSVYRDYPRYEGDGCQNNLPPEPDPSLPNCKDPVKTSPMSNFKDFSNLELLKNECDYDSDELEALNFGIIKSLENANFNETSTRIVMVMGNAGSHTHPTNNCVQNRIESSFENNPDLVNLGEEFTGEINDPTIDQVISKLKDYNATLFAFPVPPELGKPVDPNFLNEMTTIVNALNIGLDENLPLYSKIFPLNKATAIQYLTKAFEKSIDTGEYVKKVVDYLSITGNTKETAAKYGAEEIKRLMRQWNKVIFKKMSNPRQLLKILNEESIQLFSINWVHSKDVDNYVLLEKRQANNLMRVLDDLYISRDVEDLEKVIGGMINIQTGDDKFPDRFHNFFKRKYGVPILFGILQKPIKEVNRMMNSKEGREDFFLSIKKATYVLLSMASEREYKITSELNEDKEWEIVKEDIGEKKRWTKIGRSYYAWIPSNELFIEIKDLKRK
jgi:hypothetical protein